MGPPFFSRGFLAPGIRSAVRLSVFALGDSIHIPLRYDTRDDRITNALRSPQLSAPDLKARAHFSVHSSNTVITAPAQLGTFDGCSQHYRPRGGDQRQIFRPRRTSPALNHIKRYADNFIIKHPYLLIIGDDNSKAAVAFSDKITDAAQIFSSDILGVFDLNRYETKLPIQN